MVEEREVMEVMERTEKNNGIKSSAPEQTTRAKKKGSLQNNNDTKRGHQATADQNASTKWH
jgi:hypothetical protein